MYITGIKTYLCEGYHERLRWIFVQVETDEGVVGLGDATNWPNGEIIVKAIQSLAPVVVGESPFDIEKLWRKMYWANTPSAMGGCRSRPSAASRAPAGTSWARSPGNRSTT